MTQFTPTTSSSQDSDVTQQMTNTGMHMGPITGPQPPYIPYPGYAPAHPYHPFGVPPNATHGVSGTNPPPQHPSAPFPGPVNPYGPPIPHPGYLGFPPPFVGQASGSSVGTKRVAGGVEKRDTKRTKTVFRKIKNDPLFKPVLNQSGQPNGTFLCSKDGTVINPENYLKHIRTKMHLGFKLARFKCPICFKTYARLDSCKRHYFDRKCGQLAAGGPPPSFLASEASTSSASAVPAMPFSYAYPNPIFAASTSQNMRIALPAAHGTQPWGTPGVVDPKLGLFQASEAGMFAGVVDPKLLSQAPETGVVAEAAEDEDEDEDDAEFWEANELRDPYEM